MKRVSCKYACFTMFVLLNAMMLGCQQSLDRPNFDPQGSADDALEQCDTNGDGQIDMEEASAAPALLGVFKKWDTNGDEQISGEEIADRVSGYLSSSGSVVSATLTVTRKRKPLAGAEVTLEAEPFMGGGFEPMTGTTDRYGNVTLNRPSAETEGFPGIYLGLYRVKISKKENGKEILPAKYNTETTLGFDAGAQSRGSMMNNRFDLK